MDDTLASDLRTKALTIGAVDLVILPKPRPERAGPGPHRPAYHERGQSNSVVAFAPRPKVRQNEPVAAEFEDPRWATLHKPD